MPEQLSRFQHAIPIKTWRNQATRDNDCRRRLMMDSEQKLMLAAYGMQERVHVHAMLFVRTGANPGGQAEVCRYAF